VTAAFLAYLDPGSGSLILQVILGIVAASWVFLRTQWDRVRGWFHRAPAPEAAEAAPAEAAEAAEAASAEAGEDPPRAAVRDAG